MKRSKIIPGRMAAAAVLALAMLAALLAAVMGDGGRALAAYPGSNGKIVFMHNDTQRDIYVANADGSGVVQLTNDVNSDYDPAWSPDGTKIAYAHETTKTQTQGGTFDIYVMDADGSNVTRVTTDDITNESRPTWSPDGSKIAFEKWTANGEEIYTMNADGSGIVQLTNNSVDDSHPAWSPDGSKIAFVSYRYSNYEIYVMNADGSSQTRLTNDAGWDDWPDWSPDGKKIVFATNRSNSNFEIYSMNADGSSQTRLTNDSAYDSLPRYSPDGSKIIFSSNRGSDYDIYVMNTDGSNVQQVIGLSGSDDEPDWQPGPLRYYFTWYDNTGGDAWLLMANPASAQVNRSFSISIAWGQCTAGGGSYTVGPGKVHFQQCQQAQANGPVKVAADPGEQTVVSQRSLWPQGGYSLEEIPGTEEGRLSDHFYWSWYDQQSPGMKNWVLVANPSQTETVTAEVSFKNRADGQTKTKTYDILPGGRWYATFPGMMGGPVEVKAYKQGGSWANQADHRDVIASQRVLSNGDTAFNEVPGIPAEELSADYVWTWYDNTSAGARDWVLLANPPDASDPIYYEIFIAGQKVCDDASCNNDGGTWSAGAIAAGESVTPTFDKQGGPVEVIAYIDAQHLFPTDKAIASLRTLWGPSFEEVPGYPFVSLASDYHWTWYDQQTPGMTNWVLVANHPSALNSLHYEIWIGGRKVCEDSACPDAAPGTWSSGTLAKGEIVTPTFPGKIEGPVEVRTFSDAQHTTPANAIASQRVLYHGYFNEVVGTDLD